MPSDFVVAARDLSVAYGHDTVFSRLDLQIQAGETFRIRGRNGVGKSTLLAALAGELTPTQGVISYGERVLTATGGPRNGLGYMPADLPGPTSLSGTDYLRLIAALRRLSIRPSDSVNGLLDELGLASRMTTRVDEYSSGMKKKLSFVAAMAHLPSLLLLDEPFEAVDNESVEVMSGFLTALTTSGSAGVAYVSHRVDTGLRDDADVDLAAAVGSPGVDRS